MTQNTPPSTDPDMPTATQLTALKADHKQRLRDQVEVMLRALEALEPPTEHAGVERLAKAMMAAHKTMSEIYTDTSNDEEEQMYDDHQGGREELKVWKAHLERKLDRLSAARGEATMAGEFGPFGSAPDGGLGVLGQTRTASAKRKVA